MRILLKLQSKGIISGKTWLKNIQKLFFLITKICYIILPTRQKRSCGRNLGLIQTGRIRWNVTGYFDALDIRWNFLDMRLIIYISYVKESIEVFPHNLNQNANCIYGVEYKLLKCVVYCRLLPCKNDSNITEFFAMHCIYNILIYIHFLNLQVLGAIITALQLSPQRMALFSTIAWWQMLQLSSVEPLIFLVKYAT